MTWPPWRDDDALHADLAAALAQPHPDAASDRFLHAARAAYSWRRVDEELALASLVYDSAADAQLAGRIRAGGGGGARTMAFRAADLSVEIELTVDGIAGQFTPAYGGQVSVESADRGVCDQADVDELGCFVLPAPPPGPVRLRYRTPTSTVATDWLPLS